MPTLEDKIVLRAVVEVLNAIYEQDFLGFSYGFRRILSWSRNGHRVLDADIQGFDTLNPVERAVCAALRRDRRHPSVSK